MTHAPTPWKYSERQDGTCEVYDDSGELIMTDEEFYPACPNSDDMQHIVKCVNLHDELLKVIRIIGVYSDDHFIRQSCQEALKKAGAL